MCHVLAKARRGDILHAAWAYMMVKPRGRFRKFCREAAESEFGH